ncbi:hypothetical protein RDI58_007421 [Solanum bulbocastanum]|uniref:Uncharacterized protein n=1 Tax=Solanum bulbocastanum TaxID=147425 RepID=A0AAN8TST1_SOLBU
MDSMIDLMQQLVDPNVEISDTYYKANALVSKLGLSSIRIDCCEKGCMLYCKDDVDIESCKFCSHPHGIYEYLRNTVVLYLLRVRTDHLHKKKQESLETEYCFDGGDRETISAMESKIAYLNAELAAIDEREKKREERDRKRAEEIAAAKEVENKRYTALQTQLTFLFESRNIFPPCPASSDGSDQEGDEN